MRNEVTNSMEHDLSWEANSYAAGHEIFRHL